MGTTNTIGTRALAAGLAGLILFDICFPTLARAGGPGQPEFSSFSAGGAGELVDPFTGDFRYSMPLLEVDGYPIELFYNSGISMEQDASWVGLGWNLNAGAINRSMRGMPDDMNGDAVHYDNYVKPRVAAHVKMGRSLEVFGFGGFGFGKGLGYNNYTGLDFFKYFSITLSPANYLRTSLTAQLGTKSGLSLYPSVSLMAGYNAKVKGQNEHGQLGLTMGTGYNSRTGIQEVSVSASISQKSKDGKLRDSGFSPSMSFDLGTNTYFPSATNEFSNVSYSGSFKIGTEFYGLFLSSMAEGSYSKQKVANVSSTRNAYGYYYLQNGSNTVGRNVLDFNREKDGAISEDQHALALAGLTPDIFSVSGYGVGGSYRAYRGEVGHVSDALSRSYGSGTDIGVDAGGGAAGHGGGTVVCNETEQRTGEWKEGNPMGQVFDLRSARSGELTEPVYFIEANEATIDPRPERFASIGGDAPVRPDLNVVSQFDVRTRSTPVFSGGTPVATSLYKEIDRRPRSKLFSVLTRGQVRTIRPGGYESGLGLYAADQASVAHHFGEISVVGEEGKRFVYGLPVYDLEEHDVTFAVGPADIEDHTTIYGPNDPSSENRIGDDHFYQRTKLPAYASAFLLTDVLSPDYADIDGVAGPSAGDNGQYVHLAYDKVHNSFGWRTPGGVGQHRARYSAGLLATDGDDKATYVYGRKEMWYLKDIVGRDHAAVFHTTDREDLASVIECGALELSNAAQSCSEPFGGSYLKAKKLSSIQLFTRAEYAVYLVDPGAAKPERTIHFIYDYSLCPGGSNLNNGKGKLTLKEVRITYGSSDLAASTPYRFHYGDPGVVGNNPGYDRTCIDRWGGLKANKGSGLATAISGLSNPAFNDASFHVMPNNWFPYVDDIPELADLYAQAWLLKAIDLPSGGRIEVDHESDDYAYVQDKEATRMFRIAGFGVHRTEPDLIDDFYDTPGHSLENMNRIYFNTDVTPETDGGVEKYINVGELIYFKIYADVIGVTLGGRVYDHVPGYAKVIDVGYDSGRHLGYAEVEMTSIGDGGGDACSPMMKACINYAKNFYPDRVFQNPALGDDPSFTKDLIIGLVDFYTTAGLVNGLDDILNVNLGLKARGVGGKADPTRSWVRLRDPDKRRMGGGTRVREVRFHDRWDQMADDAGEVTWYGKHYNYTLEDGVSSSGVAAYEPLTGGDENPLRVPFFYDIQRVMAPDERSYQEAPFGEMFYPSPVVGYSRVVITDLAPDDITRHGTGRTVHEFFTARDFPVTTDRTALEKKPGRQNFSVGSLTKVDHKDYLTAAQGFVIRTNAMHGQPRKVSNYRVGASDATPYAYTEYKYRYTQEPGEPRKLSNSAMVVHADGTFTDEQIGVVYDMVSDMRESLTSARSVGYMVNVDGFVLFIPIIVVPIIPMYTRTRSMFRSAVLTKVVHRFPLLDEVVKYENGAMITTRNLAYDAETGQVLLTSVNDHFDQPVYTMRFPAYWKHEGMAPAYRNIGAFFKGVNIANGALTVPDAPRFFFPGDEVLVESAPSNPAVNAFVNAVDGDQVELRKVSDGSLFSASNRVVRIIRSGHRNMPGADMASITVLGGSPQDLLMRLRTGIYDRVLDASAVEYDQTWRTNCDCIQQSAAEASPFLSGLTGIWRPKRTHSYLTDRSFSREKDNTNIAKDGIFSSFRPFYTLKNGKWEITPAGWTHVQEVMEVDPRGHTTETRDALGISSSSTYGYQGSLMTATAVNAKRTQIGFTGFEDSSDPTCLDMHFVFDRTEGAEWSDVAHSGRKALRVPSGARSKVSFGNLSPCAPLECTIDLSSSEVEERILIQADGGAIAPVSYTFEVLSGMPMILPAPNGLWVENSEGAWSIQVKACDAAGCCVTEVFEGAAE